MQGLFVYGTLAPGKPNHGVLASIPGHWEQATLRGKLIDQGWGSELDFPGIVPSAEGDEVAGFVFFSEHLPENWSMLDEFEGSGYQRVLAVVKTQCGETVHAYVYALRDMA